MSTCARPLLSSPLPSLHPPLPLFFYSVSHPHPNTQAQEVKGKLEDLIKTTHHSIGVRVYVRVCVCVCVCRFIVRTDVVTLGYTPFVFACTILSHSLSLFHPPSLSLPPSLPPSLASTDVVSLTGAIESDLKTCNDSVRAAKQGILRLSLF